MGRFGWGRSLNELIETYDLGHYIDRGSIRFTGFVPDAVRAQLIAHARCVVYASLYEGFGLPIIEALNLGVPVITGYGSSLIEVGGPVVNYCDVTSAQAFGQALHRCLAAEDPEAFSRRKAWAANFTWRKTYEKIRDAAVDLVQPRNLS